MRTYTPKQGDIEGEWYLVDADGKVLGRLASEVAKLLRGKHRPTYSPHWNHGDHVIVVNAEKVKVTGKKPVQKMYRHHTRWPGGLKTTIYRDLQARFPERIIHEAVKGMLPRNHIGRSMAKKLRVFSGPTHPHEAQKPQQIEI
ncbi:MAG: 50S ribosomal protein L13 [Candidatus Abyssobacteria bacterium SURF_17]|jgi:large subunit ribosomal protein L13|uniref:Large ribosomal subunit protein uL13 n=1 Tax=Candidatus Abyssobacteria bacterium SURF_17 TaxID=2093361 RepID=A0A419EZC9_9BACT|nr:MAG: 50S ribosomal protein L13 [Candidatus Abyssubacteria bacterium SURF_17]